MIPIRVDYAGPGGACEGIRSLGLDSYGIEWDRAACATRAAAGHRTVRADLSTYRPGGGRPSGYWGSPPCQTFSTAGSGDGRAELDRLGETILAERWADADLFDSRTRHVIDSARVAATSGAPWVAMEQVPGVLPLWRALAQVLGRHGYSTWAGKLVAADYGVPQTRQRAFLMASRERCVQPPPPSHAETPGLFGEAPWISWGEALGVPGDAEISLARGQGMTERHGPRPPRPATEPAPAVMSKARSWSIDRRQASKRCPGSAGALHGTRSNPDRYCWRYWPVGPPGWRSSERDHPLVGPPSSEGHRSVGQRRHHRDPSRRSHRRPHPDRCPHPPRVPARLPGAGQQVQAVRAGRQRGSAADGRRDRRGSRRGRSDGGRVVRWLPEDGDR